ncbi:MAG: hypothetical protein IPL84_00420 [Chitinophagaceae bacterium]|nr:hypothetical protein [Chitinophagaceae bacterium]
MPTATISYAGNPFCQNAVPNTVNVTRTGNAGGTYSAAPAGLSISPTTGTVTPGTSTPHLYGNLYLSSGRRMPCSNSHHQHYGSVAVNGSYSSHGHAIITMRTRLSNLSGNGWFTGKWSELEMV